VERSDRGSTATDGPGSDPERAFRIRNVVLALAGAAVLALKPDSMGLLGEMVHSYLGNVAASFALYFAVVNATARQRWSRPLAAATTLLAVELFEATDGFGVMANTYDPLDLVANVAGVGLAVIVDVLTTRVLHAGRRPDGAGRPPRP
jgi:hypothetical protein